MKKIHIRESSLPLLKKEVLLPKFLFKLIKNHTTSLGDSVAYPSGEEYPYDYTLLKDRFKDVTEAINGLGLERMDEDFLMSLLSKRLTECKEMERPIRDELERICENAVNRLFAIPKDMVNIKCKLTDKIKFKNSVRVIPEKTKDIGYSFKDIADIEHSNKVVEKIRFINALIQVASYTFSKKEDLYKDDIDSINPHLIPLYREIMAINDYLLFTKKENISDDKPMQASYCETHLGMDGERTLIDAQGVIFPLLLQDTIKGLFDLFSSHGLPTDKEKALYVIKKADFLLAEPWDLRLGVGLWNELFGSVDDTNIIPYVFMRYVSIPTDEFNIVTKEMLSRTEKGDETLNSLIDKSTYDSGYEQFTNRINARNINKSVLSDSYFTAAELDGFDLDSEDGGDVIEEADADGMNYGELLINASEKEIHFTNGGKSRMKPNCFTCVVNVGDIEIPTTVIEIDMQIVPIRISEEDTLRLPQIHIMIQDETLRGHGIGTKVYKALINQFSGIYSSGGRRINDESISAIYRRLSQDPTIDVYFIDNDMVTDRNGNNTTDYIAIKSN